MGNEQEQGRKDAEGRVDGRWAGTKYTGINVRNTTAKYITFHSIFKQQQKIKGRKRTFPFHVLGHASNLYTLAPFQGVYSF